MKSTKRGVRRLREMVEAMRAYAGEEESANRSLVPWTHEERMAVLEFLIAVQDGMEQQLWARLNPAKYALVLNKALEGGAVLERS